MQLKRPILVGGLGLSASLWLLNIVGHSPVGHAFGDSSSALMLAALGTGLWLYKQRKNDQLEIAPPLAIGAVNKSVIEAVAESIKETLAALVSELPEEIKTDKTQPIWSEITAQEEAVEQAIASIDRERLSVAIVGNSATGKTALAAQLKDNWLKEQLQAITITETDGEEALPPADSDLVLFTTAADLTQSELKRIHTLLKAGYRTQIVFNKQDQLAPMDRQSVIQRIQTRVEGLDIGVSAIATKPKPIKVRRHQENGDIQEFTQQPEPQLKSLTDRLSDLVENEAQQLVLTTTLRQIKTLKTEAQHLLNKQRKQKALPIIEQMQWIAAGSAFASPLPSLDLLASTAINAQLIVDLGAVYGQAFSLEQAKKAAGTLAELLVKLGLVELSTQAFGSVLKTHAATYVAGGALQGVSAAYLTRMVGLSLVEFFEEQSLLPEKARKFAFGEMGDRLQAIFKATKQASGLQTFVQQALSHLPAQAKPVAAQ